MTIEPQNSTSYAVGYKKAPIQTRFQPGVSRNPTGARKRNSAMSLEEAITAKLNEPLRNPGGHRGRLTRRVVMIRNLVAKAAQGDMKALTDLLQMRKEAGPPQYPKPQKISFQEAAKKSGWTKLTDDFFAKQVRDKAEYRKKMRGDGLSLADLIGRELSRRVKATRGEKIVRVSMQDVIANKFANEAIIDGTVAKLLQKLVPEQRSRFQSSSFVEIAKPNAEEQEWLAEKHAKWLESERDSLRELCPGKDWSNWQIGDPEPTVAEIAASRARKK